MALYWFKCYSRLIHDTKVRHLSNGAFRFYISILCYLSELDNKRKSFGILEASQRDIIWFTGIKRQYYKRYLGELIREELVKMVNDKICILNWQKLQKSQKTPKRSLIGKNYKSRKKSLKVH